MAQPELLLRKFGVMIDLGMADGSPLPEHILQTLRPFMTYTHRDFLFGADRWDVASGTQRNIKLTTVRLYKIVDGKLVTCYGYTSRIKQVVASLSCDLQIEDLTPDDANSPGAYEEDWENVRLRMDFRPRQEACVQAVADNEGGIVNAPPAFGKSHLIAAIAMLYPRAKIDIVIKRRDLVERTYRALTGLLPSVGKVGGGTHKPARVTVFTADSLHHADGSADILICDEVHELMSPKHSEALARAYKFSRNFGFTATPEGRSDGADAKLEYLFGPQIFEMTWQEATELELIVPMQVRWVPIRMTHNPCHQRRGVSKKRWGIWRNEWRNSVIASSVQQHPDDDQVLILVETIEHAVHLWQFLPEYQLCYAEMEDEDLDRYKRNGMLPETYEPMTPDRRSRLRIAFENKEITKVIATDVWSTGVSFEQLAVLVRADARGSEIMDTQAPGRVARIHQESGKQKGIVYDFHDHFDRGFKTKSQTRYRNYDKKGWEQLKLEAPSEVPNG